MNRTPGPVEQHESSPNNLMTVSRQGGVPTLVACAYAIDGDDAQGLANAEFIMRAWNSFYGLVEALTYAERKLISYAGVRENDKELIGLILPMVRTAITKAEGR